MKDLPKPLMRSIASIVLSSFLLQPLLLGQALAQATVITSAVDILDLKAQGTNAEISFAALPEGMTITARVDAQGHGDYLSIQSALAQVKNGVIAVSDGVYNEHDLVIPAGVIVRGGYDHRTWQKVPEAITTVIGLKDRPTFILNTASALQGMVIRTAGTGVRIAYGPATLSQVALMNTENAVEISPYAHVRIVYSDFIQNKNALKGHVNSKVYVLDSIFQNNVTISSQPLDQASFIQNSTFFPDKNSLQNIQDLTNTVVTEKPLVHGELAFPEASADTDGINFDFSTLTDTKAQTLPGPKLKDSNGINAILLYYQLSEGDELRIVDRGNFSREIYNSTGQERSFRGWINIAQTNEIALLLDTNGDSNLPLQAGIAQKSLIAMPTFETTLAQGMLAHSSETDRFYRQAVDTQLPTMEPATVSKLTSIDRPAILGGEEWLTGSQLGADKAYFYKGFLNKILLQQQTNGVSVAFNNFSQKAQTESDTRFYSLLADYLHFNKPIALPENSCSYESNCPFLASGLSTFLPTYTFSLTENDSALHNEGGLFNSEGWNTPSNGAAKLDITLPQSLENFTATWNFQPLITSPTETTHIMTFSGNDPQQNQISLALNSSGNMVIQALDQNGIAHTSTTQEVTWQPGRKYGMTLEVGHGQAVLTRDDGTLLWQENIQMNDFGAIHIGKMTNTGSPLPFIINTVNIWENKQNVKSFSKNNGTAVATHLENSQESFSGSFSFASNTFCAANALVLKEGDSVLASFSGERSGDSCSLQLTSPLITRPAQATIAQTDLTQPLTVVWQWNPLAAQGTISLLNPHGVLLSSLPAFDSETITQSFGTRNVSVESPTALNNMYIRYQLLPITSIRQLTSLIGVERYEVLYSTNESSVKNGTVQSEPVLLDELRSAPLIKKTILQLTPGNRYFFAVRAVLENGGTTVTTHTQDLFISSTDSNPTLEPAVQLGSDLPATLALESSLGYQTVYAQTQTTTQNPVQGGSVLTGHLGEGLSLSNNGGDKALTAWTLGKDLTLSVSTHPQHIYTIPGQYIISEIRTLADNTMLKQFAFAAIGAISSDRIKVVAETWTSDPNNSSANWTNKNKGKKIPAIIGVHEPLFLLGQASDISGSSSEAYTWNYQVDWGDGSDIQNTEATKNAFNKTRLVNGQKEETPITHTYERAGIYTIVTQVQDTKGHIGSFENTVVVSMPEVYPQRISSMAGMSRLLSISGGTGPYTVTFIDGSEQTLANGKNTIIVPITETGTIRVKDRFDNETSIPISIVSNNNEITTELYLSPERKLQSNPNSTTANEVVAIESKGSENLLPKTTNTLYHFGDTLPNYLVDQLPELQSTLTFAHGQTTKTDAFLAMGLFPAILTSVDNEGKEIKKSFSLDIGRARVGVQSNNGVITGSVSPGLKGIPNSIELWKRGPTPVQLATITPNTQGRFIYIVPENQSTVGTISIKLKDKKGESTDFTKNIGYDTTARPSTLFGILETNGKSPLFSDQTTLATNALNPTFFGFNKDKNPQKIEIASNDPTLYTTVPNTSGAWIVESKKTLEEGQHSFSLLDDKNTVLSHYEFTVDRTAPQRPTITSASWSQLQGKSEPFAFIGVTGNNEQHYVQADSEGNFYLNFTGSNTKYVLAAADQAGNVSPLAQISEHEWQGQETLSLWQKIRPYFMWSFLIVLAGVGVSYARKTKV